MIRMPNFAARETIYRRVFLLEAMPTPLTRADEHWQIFDDYTAWPEYRLRKVRIPQTREWLAARETIEVSPGELREEISREVLSADEVDAHGPHAEKEIRKNRYFLGESVVDVFLGKLWGLILAEASFADEKSAVEFAVPEFALSEVTSNKLFRGENLVEADFVRIREEVFQSGGDKSF
jgi:CYTH domain-containing protein